MMRKLLFVGPKDVHTSNFLELVKPFFEEIVVVCNQKWEDESLSFYECSFSLHPRALRNSSKKIRSIVSKEDPTIIHVHQANSYGLYAVLGNKKAKKPIVLTALGSDVLVLPKTKRVFKWMVKFILNRVDKVTSDAKILSDAVVALAPKHKDKVCLVNFGISDKMVDTQVKGKIIYSNRLHNELYRIDKIIQAFSHFTKLNTEYQLIVAGTGNETDKLKSLVTDLNISDKVEFVGWQNFDQNLHWYQKAEYWVSVPSSDATAISLLEAMACGCIPILSDLPANREWINHNENGFLIEDVNSDFLSNTIGKNLDNFKVKNYQLIEMHARKEVNGNKFLALYMALLSSDKR